MPGRLYDFIYIGNAPALMYVYTVCMTSAFYIALCVDEVLVCMLGVDVYLKAFAF